MIALQMMHPYFTSEVVIMGIPSNGDFLAIVDFKDLIHDFSFLPCHHQTGWGGSQ